MTRARDVANIDTILTAKGDIYAATAAFTPARLPVGTNGQVLTANSATATGLEWVTPASGSWTQIATGSLSGAQTDITGISQSYRDLRIVITQYRKTANASSFFWVNADTGNYYVDANSPLAGDIAPGSSTTWNFSNTNTSNTSGLIIFDFPEYARTNVYKRAYITAISENFTTAGRAQWKWAPLIYWRTNAISQFNISCNSGTHAGTFFVLGGN